MEPDDDDRAFVLKWTRTWPEDSNKEDFIGRDPAAPDMFARVMFAADHPDQSRPWAWTVSDGPVQIDSGHAETARVAAREAEEVYATWRPHEESARTRVIRHPRAARSFDCRRRKSR